MATEEPEPVVDSKDTTQVIRIEPKPIINAMASTETREAVSTDTERIRSVNRPKNSAQKALARSKSIGCSGDVKERHGINC